MLFQMVGVFRRLGQRPKWVAVPCLCLLFSSLAYAQKSTAPVATPGETQKLETTQQENDRIVQLALAATVKQGEYVIGAGDLLTVEVFDVPELSRDLRVNESGAVSIPLIPVRVQVAALTGAQFQDKVTELLQANGLVTNPEVTVTVKEQHSEPITVAGAVKTPVVIQAVHQMTLLEALSQAGGVDVNAGSRVLITRAGGVTGSGNVAGSDPNDPASAATTITIDLNDLLDSGDPQFNIPLLGGDVVSVPRAGVIYAVGAVKNAGGFVMQGDRQDMTVLKILALSGGLQPTAKPEQAVIIRRDTLGAQRQELHVDLRKILALKTEDVALRQSDILYVPDSSSKHAWRKTGEIAIALATGAAIVNAGRL
jgi:polysaccharide biosynthesis/export protein